MNDLARTLVREFGYQRAVLVARQVAAVRGPLSGEYAEAATKIAKAYPEVGS